MIYKFAAHSQTELSALIGTFEHTVYAKLEHGEDLTREEKDRLAGACRLSCFGNKTSVPNAGWMFDYSQWLKRYWVQLRDWGIEEVYALDKTSARAAYGGQKILKIVEVS